MIMRTFCLFMLLMPLLIIGLISAAITVLLVLGAFVTFDPHLVVEGWSNLINDMTWLKARVIWLMAAVLSFLWWIAEDSFS